MHYKKVDIEDTKLIKTLSALATQIVKEHYDSIVGAVQNDYMVAKFQSADAITAQLEQGYSYYLVQDKNFANVGFMAFYPREKDIYLSKFYLEKSSRGKGFSKDMLKFVIAYAKNQNRDSIVLNVNKNNDAILAYEKMGFVRVADQKIDIGNGYYMDDYVYEYII